MSTRGKTSRKPKAKRNGTKLGDKPSKPVQRKSKVKALSPNYVTPFRSSPAVDSVLTFIRGVPAGERKDRSGRVNPRPDQKLADPDSLSPMKSLMDPNQVYRFRLGGQSTISMSSGVADGHFACDPSAGGVNFPEWSSLTALFSEFKLVEFGISVVRNFIGGESKMAPTLFATNLGTAVNPGSYAALADNPHFMWYNYSNAESGGKTIVLKANKINWSQVTTPTTDPYAGAPGSIQYYSNYSSGGTFANYLYVIIWGIYDFTIRV